MSLIFKHVVATFLLVLCSSIKSEQAFTDQFEYYNSTLWTQDTTIEHCDDICFMARPDHLKYNTSDLIGGKPNNYTGLLVTLNNEPCKTNKSACCEGSQCANYAAGHLSSKSDYKYGHFEWWATRIGHGDNTSINGPNNEFTCLSCYVGSPVHNEVAMCFNHVANQIHCAYWYDDTMHRKIITVDNVQFEQEYYNFHFKWSNSELEFFLGGSTLWHITESDPKKLPYEACSIKFILRPTGDAAYQEPAYLFVEQFSWAPI